MPTPDAILIGYTVLIVVVSFINLIPLDYWWIRIWDFPHLQLTVLAALGLVGWGWFGNHYFDNWLVLVPIGLLVTLCYQSWLIYPFTGLAKKQVVRRIDGEPSDTDNTIRLLVSNVFMDNEESGKVLSLIDQYRPDVVLLLETNQRWQDELTPLEASYPHRLLHPLENTYGLLLYSKLPMTHHELRHLIQDDIPSVYVQFKLPSGIPIHFYGVHPMPPSPTEHYRSTERDAELVLVGREARKQSEPVVVAGDLNDVAWSHTTRLFQRISGLFDPRIGRGLFNTFHAKYPLLRWPLDHVFVSCHFQLQRIKRLPSVGSDHFPMFIELTYVPDAGRPHIEKPRPEGNDLDEAQETVEEAK
jgi:endonuclease/exonuclease/phosphatase (EEP) superfamily protein YafD